MQEVSFFPHENIDIRIDSTTKQGFSELIEKISSHLPEGVFLYSSDYYTDQPMDLRISEIIREELFLSLGEEIPYACYVEVTQIEDTPSPRPSGTPLAKGGRGDMLSIQAYIHVESESQKVIVIGK
jgi:GTPase